MPPAASKIAAAAPTLRPGHCMSPRNISLAVSLPDEPQALQREERVDALERACVRRDQLGEAACRHGLRLDAELAADVLDDPVDLAGEPVDQSGLETGRRVLRDHGRRRGEVDLEQA